MYAPAQELRFAHLSAENGLSSNSVLAIAQEKNGFLWFGTRSGLNRYDGRRFRLYLQNSKDSTSLSANNIMSLLSDSDNTLWVGSSGGLDRYDSTMDRFAHIRLGPNPSYNINCLYQDRKGMLWVGTTEGLFSIDRKTKKVSRSFTMTGNDGIAGNDVRSIFEDRNNLLWIGTSKGLTSMQWKHNSYIFETFRHQPAVPGSLSSDYVTTIAEDNKGRLWIGTQNNGLNLLVPGQHSFTHFLADKTSAGLVNNNVRKIMADRTGLLWIGTQEGLSLIDPVTQKISSYQNNAGDAQSLSQNSIYSLYEDLTGSVWIGTYFGGINTTYSFTTPFRSMQKKEDGGGINNNVVSSIKENNEKRVWIGTEGGGLNCYNKATGRFSFYTHNPADAGSLGSNLVKVVYIDRDQQVWCGTHGGGLNVLDRAQNRFTRYLYKEGDPSSMHMEVISMTEDEEGRFWVVTTLGLRLFKRSGTRLDSLSLQSVKGLTDGLSAGFVYTSRSGTWIGAYGKLYQVTGNTALAVNTDLTVNSMMEDTGGNLWASISYGGLARYNSTNNQLVRVPTKALLNRQVIGMLEDGERNLWLSTDKGLVKYNRQQQAVQTYTISDGLAGNEFNNNAVLKDSEGEFFFGGYNGITRFFPQQIETNQYIAPLVFTGLRLFGNVADMTGNEGLLKKNMVYTREITFNHDQNVFTLEFALLSFIKSNKNRYAYRLEGVDKDWNEISNPSVTYTNLSPGTYTFWVKGANNDGIWGEPVSLKIKILPPFWLTWWAYTIYALILAGVLFVIARFFFLRALLRKEDELHKVKLNFFTNVSHEIRTHLTLIMVPVEKMLERKQKEDIDHQSLAQIKSNATRLLKLVSEIMDFRKAETDHLQLQPVRQNLVPFLQEIYTSFREISLAKNIGVSFIHDAEDIPVNFDKDQLEKVFFNLLANAFKFTPDGGRIVVSLVHNKQEVSVQVTDNGRGIDPAFQQKLFTSFFQVADHGLQNTGYGIGLALSKKIVELHKGQITVESEPATEEKNGKTSFTVTLPLAVQPPDHFYYQETAEAENPYTGSVSETEKISASQEGMMYSLLVAEDNPELRLLISDTLDNSYRVLPAEDGLQAWEIATAQVPDIIISDVMMPGMDGFALCEKIKTDERTSHIPVILLTARTTQNDQVSGLETGADVYLTKPFSTKILELQVRNQLQSKERLRARITQQLIQNRLNESDEKTNLSETPALTAVDQEFLNRLLSIVEEHIDNPDFGVEMFSRKVAMSAPVLYKKLKAVTGLSVNDFIKSIRLRKAASLLLGEDITVYEAAYRVGYNDRKYFSQEFKKQFGVNPAEYISRRKTK